MVLAADAPMTHETGEFGSIPAAASTLVYEGAMVGENGSGYGRGLTAGDRFVGHAEQQCDNSADSSGGARNIRVRTGRYRLEVTLTGVAITDVERSVYASADSTLTFSSAGNSFVGVVKRYVAANKAVVEFRPGEVDEFGPSSSRVLKTDDYTVLATDNGKVIELGTDGKTIMMLATVAGFEVTIVNTAADGTAAISVDVNAADKFLGGCGLSAGADGAAATNTKATQRRGDYIKLIGDGTNGWNIVGKRGIWAIA